MNAVEIEQAISELAERPFDGGNFPYAFLEAFGNKETTIKRLRAGASNKSDSGGVLQTNNIHIAVSEPGQVTTMLTALKQSPATSKAKAKFVLATDGVDFEAEDLGSGDTVACAYGDFPDHFGFFLPLAGITTVRQITENAFDIRATSRMNRLYVELLRDNPAWGKAERRHDLNHFMARLIFCFFAEDTGIFSGAGLFTNTIAQMSARDSSNTHEVIGALFRAMNIRREDQAGEGVPRWAASFPYVNGDLFSGSLDVPRFSKIARSYLLHIGSLDWTKINPDIFGSMIQAVTEDEERGALGMHYTSVPNILKVLNPLFLDDLRAKLQEADDNPRMLLNLRNRMSRIRIFDPACGSGNFLVIAYKEMRAIEAEINKRRAEADRRSDIPKTNFVGIELRDFPAEIARLALVIAEYQCDVLYRGHRLALAEFLPLDKQNWIRCGNALRVDWLSICPPTGTVSQISSNSLFSGLSDQATINFENEGGETYICGNPPYKGGTKQDDDQKSDMTFVFAAHSDAYKSLDYVSGWFFKFAQYAQRAQAKCAFVSTNSVVQGEQVARLWPLIFHLKQEILFAHTSFKWANLASHAAGVTVVIIGLGTKDGKKAVLYDNIGGDQPLRREVENINPYLVPFKNVVIEPRARALSAVAPMVNGSKPADGGHLLLGMAEAQDIRNSSVLASEFIRQYVGASEAIDGALRYCLWINDERKNVALSGDKLRDSPMPVVTEWRYRGRTVTTEEIDFIRRLIADHPRASRRRLSEKLCEAWQWRQANGAPRDMVCRGLLLMLHRAGQIELPVIRFRPPNPLARRERPQAMLIDTTPLNGALSDIRPVSLEQVRKTADEPLFNSLMEQHHYLGYEQPVGEHLKYLVWAQGRPIACMAWSSAPRHLGSRDRYIGWSAEARRRNIRFVAYNTRFLILPWIKVPHLASHILGRVAAALPGDWERMYSHPVHFAETFIDPDRFRGTCYRAANWVLMGRTTGRGKASNSYIPNRSIKEVLGLALTRRFRELLSDL